MNLHQTRAIEDWFTDHEDGEFCLASATCMRPQLGDAKVAEIVIYTTKVHCLSRLQKTLNPGVPFVLVGLSGLPTADHLSAMIGQTKSILFVGDADPPDMLIYGWLKEHLSVQWYGVSDAFLQAYGTREPAELRIPLASSEREAIPLVQAIVPDYRGLLGSYCGALWDQGLKIELEGATVGPRS